jgi:predicted dienelactone hydrolase
MPVLIYGAPENGRFRPMAVISHGYGGSASDYGFLADHLTARGYVVVSIQHLELPGDPPMVNTGDLAQTRRPVWQVGADSIGAVIAELRRRGFADARRKVAVIGHSNGGDMTMLFASQHPEQVELAMSLDNRRMPLPRSAAPRICSVRSGDFVADVGVLPSPAEQAALGQQITASTIRHNDMTDRATSADQAVMLRAVDRCFEIDGSFRR